MELNANFKEVEHSYLIYVESPGLQMGTVTIDPANEGNIYKEGTEITVKAEPKDGYEFAQWMEVDKSRSRRSSDTSRRRSRRIQILCRGRPCTACETTGSGSGNILPCCGAVQQ